MAGPYRVHLRLRPSRRAPSVRVSNVGGPAGSGTAIRGLLVAALACPRALSPLTSTVPRRGRATRSGHGDRDSRRSHPQPGERGAAAVRMVPSRPARAGFGGQAPAVLRSGLPPAGLRAAVGDGEGRPAGRRRPGVPSRAGRPAGPALPAAVRPRGRPDPAQRAAHEGRARAVAGRSVAHHRPARPSLGHRTRRLIHRVTLSAAQPLPFSGLLLSGTLSCDSPAGSLPLVFPLSSVVPSF